MKTLRDRTLAYIREHSLLRPGERLAVAVSGGADSTALLRMLLGLRVELGVVISAAHFNHKIRGAESDKDAEFVRALAAEHDLEFRTASGDTLKLAREKHMGIEAAARELRYKFFASLIGDDKADKVATAHTLDDQAETVLMRLVRGAGTSGLAGILPELSAGADEKQIIRPFLTARRSDIVEYLRSVGQSWREDESNASQDFLRNRVRQELLPQLEKFNPAIAEALAHSAEIAREEEKFWAREISRILASEANRKPGSLASNIFTGQSIAVQRRLVREISKEAGLSLDFEDVEKIRHAVGGGKAKIIEVPRGRAEITRAPGQVVFAVGRRENRSHSAERQKHAPAPKSAQVLMEKVRSEEQRHKAHSRGTMPGGESR